MLTILTGDAIQQLRTLPDESVQCCVTSPPYWGLRDYGTAAWEGGDSTCDHKSGRFERGGLSSKQSSNNGSGGDEATGDCPKCGAKRIDSQLGLEKTPDEYVKRMVEVFREVRRVLRRDGTLWLNLGDSYNAGTSVPQKPSNNTDVGNWNKAGSIGNVRCNAEGLKVKDLCGIPWRAAFALQADGWWLRSDIIWAKPNPMPESVTDRPTKAHEYVFLLTKSASYFYDAEAIKEQTNGRELFGNSRDDFHDDRNDCHRRDMTPNFSRNKRSVWTVATAPYPEAHFATYPPDLIKPCIMAGTSAKGCCAKCGAPWDRILEHREVDQSANEVIETNGVPGLRPGTSADRVRKLSGSTYQYVRGETLGWQSTCKCGAPWEDAGHTPCTVLDPFAGSGTTGAVALELGRKAVLIELNPKYVDLIRQRCDITPGLQLA